MGNNMSFEEFQFYVVTNIKRFLPGDYLSAGVSINPVQKNNGTQLLGLMIKKEERNICPTIYLEPFFADYQNGKDLVSVMKDIAACNMAYAQEKDFNVTQIMDFKTAKDKILCRLVNAEDNAEYLANKPHTIVEDLAVVYSVYVGESESGTMTITITTPLLERYGISTEELHQVALDNLSKINFDFMSMRDVLISLMGGEDIMIPEEDDPLLYVLSNESRLNGAVGLLRKDLMEDISVKLHGDFVILPCSIHEVLIHPLRGDFDRLTLENMVREINTTQVAREERLSDHIYMYDSVQKEVILADKMEERLNERSQPDTADEAARQGHESEQINMQRRHKGR